MRHLVLMLEPTFGADWKRQAAARFGLRGRSPDRFARISSTRTKRPKGTGEPLLKHKSSKPGRPAGGMELAQGSPAKGADPVNEFNDYPDLDLQPLSELQRNAWNDAARELWDQLDGEILDLSDL